MRWSPIVLLPTLVASGLARAEAPIASYIFPAGGRRGTTVEIKVGGLNLPRSCSFAVLGPGISTDDRLRRVPTTWFEGPLLPLPDSQQAEDYPKDHAGSIRIAADAPLGVRYWRVWSAQGAAPAMKFEVGDLPEVVEREVAGDPVPVAVAPPVTINGRIFPREDVDLWSFSARAGRVVRCEVRATRLGSPLDARIEILGPDGRRLAESDDALGDDPALTFTAPIDGTYQVRIFDANVSGSQAHVYRLSITHDPGVRPPFPLGGRRGSRIGAGVTVPDGPASGPADFADHPPGGGPPIVLEADDLPEVLESGPDGEESPRAVPAVLNGRIDEPGDVDRWAIELKKGEALEFDLRAARLGSPLSGRLILTDRAGKELAHSDSAAGTGTDPPPLRFAAPASGAYIARVESRLSSRGGPEHAYRLRIAPPPVPDFRLRLASDALALPRGGEARLRVLVERRGAFSGPIALTVAGLPDGVTAPPAEIPAGQPAAEMILKAGPTAPVRGVPLTVTGSAKIGDRTVAKNATLPAARGEPEIDSVLVAITIPTPFKLVADADFRWAPRGSVFRRAYRIDRGGFDGPITVRLADRQARHLQGVTGPEIVVPPDASRFDYPISLPPWMETGRTSRAVVVAIGTVKDADGSEHEVSYSSTQANDQAIAVIEPGRLGLELGVSSLSAAPGEFASLPLRVVRGKDLTGPIAVRIEVPEHIRGIASEPVEIPAGQADATLLIRCSAPIAEPVPLLVRATLLDRGDPVVAEATVRLHPRR